MTFTHLPGHDVKDVFTDCSCVVQMSGMGPSGKLSIHYIVTLCHMLLGSALHAIAPSLFKPAGFAAFRGSDVSYREIVFNRWRDFAITVVAATAAVGWAAKTLLSR
jgi:hypothetical protein